MLKSQTKKITAFMSVVAMLLSMLLYFPNGTFSLDLGLKASAATITPTKPSSEGTSDSPYKIGTVAELYWFAACVNGTDDVSQNKSAWAVLTADITVNSNLLSSLKYDTGGNATNGDSFTSWTPIGNYSNAYSGTFDGQGHTVSGLYFNDSSVGYVGLFGSLAENGEIRNIGVIDSYFNGYSYVGGVCGKNDGTTKSCYSTGTVRGDAGVGGVCGYNLFEITNCFNTGTVSGTKWVGGVCGINYLGKITNCYFNSNKYIGDVVGNNDGGTVTDVEGKTTVQFANGEICYLLNGSTSEGALAWRQTIGTDPYPVLNWINYT